MKTTRPINSFRCLTFDCFGTLIEWETSIYERLQPLVQQLPEGHSLRGDRAALLKAYKKHDGARLIDHPRDLYKDNLAAAYGDFAQELGVSASEDEKRQFGASVGDWPAFPDTLDALKRLHKHFKLVILSNVDHESFDRTLSGPLAGIDFDAVYTAQDIGSYKPDMANFEYLIEHVQKDLGVAKEDILHTAQSLHHDHAPAKKIGLVSAWINRQGSFMGGNPEDYEDKVEYTWQFKTMGEMADALEEAQKADKAS
jgi:2-haloalkanoic acid dehalogenase type II